MRISHSNSPISHVDSKRSNIVSQHLVSDGRSMRMYHEVYTCANQKEVYQGQKIRVCGCVKDACMQAAAGDENDAHAMGADLSQHVSSEGGTELANTPLGQTEAKPCQGLCLKACARTHITHASTVGIISMRVGTPPTASLDCLAVPLPMKLWTL